MVEKFNFYDIYGYLIPGLVLVGLVWMPMGLVWGEWPKQEIASAILLLLLAYILGHLLQGLSDNMLPSTMVDKGGRQRHPSNVLLDTEETLLNEETKKRIRSLSAKLFGIDLGVPGDDNRRTAFFQARSALLKQKGDKGAVYWEQFEGLYAMARNVSLALGMGAFYMFGWGIALICHLDQFYSIESVLALVLLCVLLILIIGFTVESSQSARKDASGAKSSPDQPVATPKDQKKNKSGVISHRGLAASLALIAFASGSQIALSRTDTLRAPESKTPCAVCCLAAAPEVPESTAPSVKIERPGLIMLLLGLVVLTATFRIHRAFKGFAKEFAVAVWRDFANFEIAAGEGTSKN